jgi:tRNA (uracil-5-)-methyltransferase TRM9
MILFILHLPTLIGVGIIICMQAEVIQQLLDINYQFYQTFGGAFAATRRRVQPGIHQVLEQVPNNGFWLDLGCGSGALAQYWVSEQRQGGYHGLDFSAVLLQEARDLLTEMKIPSGLEIQFMQADLLSADWITKLKRRTYDGVLCFAALHHIPGYKIRLGLVQMVRSLLPGGGRFIHSNWQFHHSPRLMARVQPWSRIGVEEDLLEDGDTLLDWRYSLPGQSEHVGYRYVHRFSSVEFEQLAKDGGFQILERFESDGEGGRLGLYQVWQAI